MNFRIFFAVLLIVAACNNEKADEVSGTGEHKTSGDASKISQADETQKKTEELQKLAPYTLDQMKALLPAQLLGGKRSDISANSASGAPYVEESYSINDSAEIKVTIFDCAGDAGVGIYSVQYSNLMNFEMVSDEEYTKTIDFNRGKAIEHGKKDNSGSSLTYFAAGRLLVTLEGSNTSVDMLKKAAADLNLR